MRKRNWSSLPFLAKLLLALVLSVFFPMDIISAPSEQFSPPTEITLVMYALREDGSINDQDYLDPHCSSVGATTYVYGCTFYDGTYEEGPGNDGIEKAYPFGDTYTVTIGYESHSIAGEPGVEFGYLHNVISQEMTEGSPLAAYAAQAVAARTYAYTQTLGGQLVLNNSSAYQVYIPYRYDGLGEGMGDAIKAQRRAIVGQAVT